jgi:hypothetical protein
MTEKEHREDVQDLGAELERLRIAYRVACENIVELNEQRETLKNALGSALNLIDQLLTNVRLAGGIPSQSLILAKGKLDIAMKKLFRETDE